jgi:2-polyprenyl-3-methyl-5-hydroxy-6-metoxy-1,4-benzoquinol methylase
MCQQDENGPLTFLDRFLQQWRIRKALPWLAPGARVLDVGAHQGELFERAPWIGPSLGIEPHLGEARTCGPHRLRPGRFPADDLPDGSFDTITMLAVVEHFDPATLDQLGPACQRLLSAGGRVVITVPSPWVDHILAVLRALRLVHGMELEQHHGFLPSDLLHYFGPANFQLETHQRFQLGLNHLFVFRRR